MQYKVNYFLVIVSLFLSACSHTYVPNPNTFRMDPVHKFVSKNTITIINDQHDTSVVNLGGAGVHSVYGNLHDWTEIAIVLANNTVQEHGMAVTEQGNKILKLKIDKAKMYVEGGMSRSNVQLSVMAGNGYEQIYFAENRSPETMFRASDGAVMRVVAKVFQDPRIIAYLTDN